MKEEENKSNWKVIMANLLLAFLLSIIGFYIVVELFNIFGGGICK